MPSGWGRNLPPACGNDLEKPLIGQLCSTPKVQIPIESKLFQIPEESPLTGSTMPIHIQRRSFKEMIVYGSLESPTSSVRFLFDPRTNSDDENRDRVHVDDENNEIDSRLGFVSKEAKNDQVDPQPPSSIPFLGDAKALHARTRRSLKRSMTAPALAVAFEKRDKFMKPQLQRVSSIVLQASLGLVLYLFVGVLIYLWKRDEFSGSTTHPFIDALYFCIVTMCTIGYGDIAPLSTSAKLFSCAFVLVGFGFIDILLSGMVAFVLERQEALLLSAFEGSHHETATKYLVNTKKGRMRIRMKVALAMAVVILCLGIGTIVMRTLEHLSWLDSFYLACMSVTTVGYGDRTFHSMQGRLFAAIWLLVSTLVVARAFLFFAEAHIHRRNRLIAKWVLHRQMSVGDLVAADLDKTGYITKSQFVVYKLKEMGKITEKDIHEIFLQFRNLDTDNSGRITLSCLLNS